MDTPRSALSISSLSGCSELILSQVLPDLPASSTRASLSFPYSTCAEIVNQSEHWIREATSPTLGLRTQDAICNEPLCFRIR